MFNFLISYWKWEAGLTQWQLFRKFISPIAAIFFTWGFFSSLYQYNLDKNSLVLSVGKISDIKITEENKVELKITLQNFNNEFSIPNEFKSDYAIILKELNPGDSISIYTLNKWQAILAMGKDVDIYQLEKGNKPVFPIYKIKNIKKETMLLFGIGSLILWIVSFFNSRR